MVTPPAAPSKVGTLAPATVRQGGGMTSVPPLAARFREHAGFCDRSGAPLYRELLLGLAADLEAGGVVAAVCAGREDAPTGDVVQLRLLAALHRLVLTGRAPQLEPFYRSAPDRRSAGPADPKGAWPVAREVIRGQVDELRAALDQVPQTNETGRSAALAVGLAALAGLRPAAGGPLRVRLLELGASAGLNLLVDRYRIEGRWAGRPWAWGPPGSALRLPDAVRTEAGPGAERVPEPGDVVLVERAGCDLHPVDPTTPEGALRLRSFVWPDHTERRDRLEAALGVARAAGPGAAPVERAGAADWLEHRLAGPAPPGAVTVVWHSVVLQYLPPQESRRVTDLVAAAAARMPVHRLCLESSSAPYTAEPVVRLDDRVLAVSSAHGLPVRLGAA
jgi:hypothetical protein